MTSRPGEELDPGRVVIRDKRRIDPDSGEVRGPAEEDGSPAPAGGIGRAEAGPEERLRAAQNTVAERTADLQRLTAEFANYRKRIERDRLAMAEQATAAVLASLLPVLDDVERARRHGELTGGFKAVGESLEAVTAKMGLEPFGEVGEPFDPLIHEALLHTYSPDVTEATCVEVLQRGYRLGSTGRVLRPARVAVAEPGELPAEADPGTGTASAAGAARTGAPVGREGGGDGASPTPTPATPVDDSASAERS